MSWFRFSSEWFKRLYIRAEIKFKLNFVLNYISGIKRQIIIMQVNVLDLQNFYFSCQWYHVFVKKWVAFYLIVLGFINSNKDMNEISKESLRFGKSFLFIWAFEFWQYRCVYSDNLLIFENLQHSVGLRNAINIKNDGAQIQGK